MRVYCYDILEDEIFVFNSVKKTNEELKVKERTIYEAIKACRVVNGRFIFSEEEITEIELITRKKEMYKLVDEDNNNIYRFVRQSDLLRFINRDLNKKILPCKVSRCINNNKIIESKYRIYK